MRIFLSILLLLFFIIAVGTLTGRMLGVRLGRWRGALTGAIGWLGGVTATAFIIGSDKNDGLEVEIHTTAGWFAFIGATIAFGVLSAMPVAIGIDLLTRTGPIRPRGRRRRIWLHPFRSLKRALAPYGRLREVVGNARRQNMLHWRYASRAALGSPDLSRRLRTVLEESGGILVKFGQIASTRSDILPEPLTVELSNLRSDVRPVPPEEVRALLEDELGEPAEQAFASFEWEPLAAASIGQTHRAVLHDGTRVVVKVQRPGIGDVVARDAAVLRLASRQLERRVEAARSVHLGSLAEELIGGVQAELNYLTEAAVGMKLRERRAKDVGISIPKVYSTLSTQRVLVMEEVIARPISDPDALAACSVPRGELARRVLASFIGQILEDGLYHADPHPGNMLIDSEGTIWLLDFGSVGRLDGIALDGLRGIAIGVAANDASMLARAARDLAGNTGATDLRALEADLGASLSQLDTGGVDPRLIGNVLSIMERHEMRPPASMTLLARALLTLEGTLKQLDPSFNLGESSKELAMNDRDALIGTPRDILQREALRTLPSLRTLPEHAETLANQLRSGRLTVRTERYAGGDRDVVDGWVDRAVLTAIGGFGVMGSAVLLFAAGVTNSNRVQTSLWLLGFFGLAAGSILLMRGAAQALRRLFSRVN